MKKIRSWFEALAQLHKNSEEFVKTSSVEIMEKNSMILKKVSPIYLVGLIVYGVVMHFVMHNYLLDLLYVLFFTIQLIYFGITTFYFKHKTPKPNEVTVLCLLFESLIMAMIVTVSIFPYQEKPAIYFSTFLVLTTILFIFRLRYMLIFLGSCEALFLLMVFINKTGDALSYDFFSSITALLLSVVASYVIHYLRIREHISSEELKLMSARDKLTGLLNKGTCEYQCKSFFMETEKPQAILMVIDIDNFKSVNDRFGHSGGDEVLQRVGGVLSSLFRGYDIVGRIGRDEFAVLMKNTVARTIIPGKIQQLRNGFSKMFNDITTKSISCSIGIAVCDKEALSYERLFARADKALYTAKKNGKNSYSVYEPEDTADSNMPKLLIADDSDVSRAILVNNLSSDFRILEAVNGIEAMSIMHEYNDSLAAVLLDLSMPEKNGYEVLDEKNHSHDLKDIPVLVISENSSAELQSLELGADDMIPKPFDIDIVRLRIFNALKKAHA